MVKILNEVDYKEQLVRPRSNLGKYLRESGRPAGREGKMTRRRGIEDRKRRGRGNQRGRGGREVGGREGKMMRRRGEGRLEEEGEREPERERREERGGQYMPTMMVQAARNPGFHSWDLIVAHNVGARPLFGPRRTDSRAEYGKVGVNRR